MVTSLDRLIASTSGMAGALYALAALTLWYVVLFRRENSSGVIYDRAVAWSAMAILFIAIVAGRLRWVDWSRMGWLFVISTLAVMLAGLYSVRTITGPKFGNFPLLIFAAVVLTSGVSIFLWG